MPEFSVNAVVFCDDVRKETSNKDILIGAYGGPIVVPAFPVSMPVAIWIEFTLDDSGSLEIDMKIKLPGIATDGMMRLNLDIPPGIETTSIATPQLMCPIVEPGTIEVSIKRSKDAEWRLIKTKKVVQAELAIPTSPLKVIYRSSPNPKDPEPIEPIEKSAPVPRRPARKRPRLL